MAVREGVVEEEMPERGIRYFVAEQTALSAATGLLGALSLSLLVIGIPVVTILNGLLPYENIVATIESTEILVLLLAAIALGMVATIVGSTTFRRMATKPSREAAVAGAVFGIQAVILGGLLLWFRAGAVEVFERALAFCGKGRDAELGGSAFQIEAFGKAQAEHDAFAQ